MWLVRRRKREDGRRGQSTTEYIITIAVLSIAMLGVTRAFYDVRGPFHKSMKRFSRSVGSFVAKPPNGTLGPK